MSSSSFLGIPGMKVARRLARLTELEATASSLQHDRRGMLTSALLAADALHAHLDPKVAQAGEVMVVAIARIIERLGWPGFPE